MDADRQNANTNMRALGEENGYIVVQPNAPGHNWNTGVHWVPPFDQESPGDRAINNVVQELATVTAWKVDRNRIHLTGFSEGGWVTGRMLCTYQHFYKSFVMLAGASNADPLECVQADSPQPPLLVNQGLNDYSSHWGAWTSSLEKVKGKWKLGEGKVIAGNATCLPGTDEHGVGCYQRTRYESPTGTPLEVLSYSYVADYFLKGHCFPGSTDTKRERIGLVSLAFSCPGTPERKAGAKAAYTIGEEAMKWFMAHEKGLPVFV
jgi:dienelactone hydrolase